MNWLTPIGFLGLSGLIVLILIYVIKPNYQNKKISSTYIWRMSLKYKKQRVPVSKIQNLLMFICQALILLLLGGLLASPVIAGADTADANEKVIIVDASANMRMTESGETRFQRALAEAKKMTEKTVSDGSRASLIVADGDADFLFRRVGEEELEDAMLLISSLNLEGAAACTWSGSDMNGAIELARSVLDSNPRAEVYLYTGTEYVYHEGVNTVSVAKGGEWNATVLGCTAELDNDNHYRITVDAACYGKTDFITVYCKVHGVNGDPTNTVVFEKGEFFDPTSEEKSVVFTSDDIQSGAIYSYDYVEAYVSVRDSLADDNSFFLYGGRKPTVKIQYASSSPNNFFESIIRSLRQSNRDSFDIQYSSLGENELPATEGFDLYIFEHRMPDVLPTDGIVLLVDPDSAPAGSGLEIGKAYEVDSNSRLSSGVYHKLTDYISPSGITIAKYNDVVFSEGYEELLFYNGRPVMLLKDTPEAKVMVWAIDLNYSNLIALPDFAILIYNAFNYFLPSTFTDSAFEIGEVVKLNGRGTSLKVTGNGEEYVFDNGKGELTLTAPGTYTATQNSMNSEALIIENFFVRMPASESNTAKTVELLPSIDTEYSRQIEYKDILTYVAIALTLLMFGEWVLEIKKNY